MKTYKIKTTFIFTGEFYINAMDKESAKQIAEQECGMTYGGISTSAEEDIVDWDFNMIPEKRIKSITLKRKNKKQK